jgi:cation-transporting ATPase E
MDTITFKGLTTDEVQARERAGQTNDAHEQTSRSLKDILRANILTRFNALLLALFVVVLVVGSPVDGLFALVIVINSAIGIFQEVRAKRTLDRLAILHAPVALVLRDRRIENNSAQRSSTRRRHQAPHRRPGTSRWPGAE